MAHDAIRDTEDFIIGTGENHSIKDFVETTFARAGIPDWQKYVEIDPRYFRPTEVDSLIADITKAKTLLQWEPTTSFRDLAHLMVDTDLQSYGVKK